MLGKLLHFKNNFIGVTHFVITGRDAYIKKARKRISIYFNYLSYIMYLWCLYS